MGLPGRVLALARGQHLAEDGLGNLRLVDAGAFDDGLQNGRGGAEIMGGRRGENFR